LFALGGYIALLTLPKALEFLLDIGGSQLRPELTADKYLGLVSLMIIAFGVAFEFPVVLVSLLLARVLTTQQLRRWRRPAILIIGGLGCVHSLSARPCPRWSRGPPRVTCPRFCRSWGEGFESAAPAPPAARRVPPAPKPARSAHRGCGRRRRPRRHRRPHLVPPAEPQLGIETAGQQHAAFGTPGDAPDRAHTVLGPLQHTLTS